MNALSKRQLDSAYATLRSAESEVEIAKSQLTNYEIELGYTRISAPISGLIGMTAVHVGDYVTTGESSSQVLNTISDIQQVRVKFSITEDDYLNFYRAGKVGSDNTSVKLPITITLADGSAYPEPGTFDFANREINPSTGSMLLQAIFDNHDQFLRPGQFVKVRVQTGEIKDAVIVPQSTVTQIQNTYQVTVLTDNNTLETRMVDVGDRIGNNWIITKGLSKGERVAALGNQALLRSNVPVNPVDMKWNYDQGVSDNTTTKP